MPGAPPYSSTLSHTPSGGFCLSSRGLQEAPAPRQAPTCANTYLVTHCRGLHATIRQALHQRFLLRYTLPMLALQLGTARLTCHHLAGPPHAHLRVHYMCTALHCLCHAVCTLPHTLHTHCIAHTPHTHCTYVASTLQFCSLATIFFALMSKIGFFAEEASPP